MSLTRRLAYSWLFMFFVAVGITIAVAIYTISADYAPGSIIVLWLVALGISLLGNLALMFLTLWLHIRMSSQPFKGRSIKRAQLLRLTALFGLLLISKLGNLLELAVLEIVPYLLFQLMLLLTRNSISGYEAEPQDLSGDGDDIFVRETEEPHVEEIKLDV